MTWDLLRGALELDDRPESGPENNCARCGTPLSADEGLEDEGEDGGTWRYCSEDCLLRH